MVRKLALLCVLAMLALVTTGYLGRDVRKLSQLRSAEIEGKIAFGRAGSIWLYEGSKERRLTSGPKDRADKRDGQPALSADGTEIVFTRFDEGFSDLYKLDLREQGDAKPVALTNNRPEAETGGQGYTAAALWAMQPAWSPNGERIAYTSDVRTEYPGLFLMNPDGGDISKAEYLDHSIQTVEHPSWSPDGKKIVVANYLTRNGKGQIWSLDTVSGKWTELTDSKDGAYDPAWSPDGEWVAFTMREGSSHNIYVVPTDAQHWTESHPTPIRLTTDGASRAPAWSPDGSHLAYLSLKDGSFDLYTAELHTDQSGNPSLGNLQKLLEKANIDAGSGLSWGQ